MICPPSYRPAWTTKTKRVRTVAINLLGELDIAKRCTADIVKPIFFKGTVSEQQALIKVLGKMPLDKSQVLLSRVIDLLKEKNCLTEFGWVEWSGRVFSLQSAWRSVGNLAKKQIQFWMSMQVLCKEAMVVVVMVFSFITLLRSVCAVMPLKATVVRWVPFIKHWQNTHARANSGNHCWSQRTVITGLWNHKSYVGWWQQVTRNVDGRKRERNYSKTSMPSRLKWSSRASKKRENYPSGMPPMGKALSKKKLGIW